MISKGFGVDAQQLLHELRSLANRWALRARDYAREAKEAKDEKQASYSRGFADGYYKAATELAAMLQGDASRATGTVRAANTGASGGTTAGSGQNATASPINYVSVSLGEIVNILEFAGASPRDVNVRPDKTVYAVFSRWAPHSESERVAMIAGADPRIVILSFGKVKDSSDPYVEFAFKEG